RCISPASAGSTGTSNAIRVRARSFARSFATASAERLRLGRARDAISRARSGAYREPVARALMLAGVALLAALVLFVAAAGALGGPRAVKDVVFDHVPLVDEPD